MRSIELLDNMWRDRSLLQDGGGNCGSGSSAARGAQHPCWWDVPCVQSPPSFMYATCFIVPARIPCFGRLRPTGAYLNRPLTKNLLKGQSAIHPSGPPASSAVGVSPEPRWLAGYVMVLVVWTEVLAVHIYRAGMHFELPLGLVFVVGSMTPYLIYAPFRIMRRTPLILCCLGGRRPPGTSLGLPNHRRLLTHRYVCCHPWLTYCVANDHPPTLPQDDTDTMWDAMLAEREREELG